MGDHSDEGTHKQLQHGHGSTGSRGMLRQRSKSSFGKLYNELSPDASSDSSADNNNNNHPSSPVGCWPSSTKSSSSTTSHHNHHHQQHHHHQENVSAHNLSFQESSSSPQLFHEPSTGELPVATDVETGQQQQQQQRNLASRRNRSRLSVRVDQCVSEHETKEEPRKETLQEAVKRKLYAQGFLLPRGSTPRGLRSLASSMDPRILMLIGVIVVLAIALIVVSLSKVRLNKMEERLVRIEEAERRTHLQNDALMPNLFVEMLGVSRADTDDKLRAGWNHIFRGDPIEEACYFEVKGDMAYILNTEGDFVTSEGMSYGMMIAVQYGKKGEFDRLWRWVKTYMRNRAGDHKGLLAWKLSSDGTVMDDMPAPDAETYVATALLIAHTKWGSKSSEHDYLSDARELISTMSRPKTGVFNGDGKVIFSPNNWGRNHSNPSYHLPAFYEMWARVFEREEIPGAAFWHKAAKASRTFLKRAVNLRSGLAPDYTYLNGAAAPDENGHGFFQYDAWRVGANLAMDWAWWGRDEWQRAHADTLQNFFMSKGIKSYTSIYNLQGETLPKGPEHSVGLIAMNAVSSLAATRRGTAAAFVEELWNAELPSGKWRYYGAMLYLLGLLQVTGHFQPA